MQLIPKGSTDLKEIFHVPTGIGKALILTGVVEEYIPPVESAKPTQWQIFNGAFSDNAPILKAYCPVCKNSMTTENATGKVPFRHHLGAEFCPADVLENYLAAMQRWNEIHRPKQARAARELQDAIRSHSVTVWR